MFCFPRKFGILASKTDGRRSLYLKIKHTVWMSVTSIRKRLKAGPGSPQQRVLAATYLLTFLLHQSTEPVRSWLQYSRCHDHNCSFVCLNTQRDTTGKFSTPKKLFHTFQNGPAKGILQASYNLSRCKWIKYRGANKSLARPKRKNLQRPNYNFCKPLQKKKKNQKLVRPTRSPRQQWPPRREKWRSFNCFFSPIGLRTYQHPCIYR